MNYTLKNIFSFHKFWYIVFFIVIHTAGFKPRIYHLNPRILLPYINEWFSNLYVKNRYQSNKIAIFSLHILCQYMVKAFPYLCFIFNTNNTLGYALLFPLYK